MITCFIVCQSAELRANIARQALNSTSGSSIGSQELLRRLRETQALLIKFSEENGRLARDNEKLQASAFFCVLDWACARPAGGQVPGSFLVLVWTGPCACGCQQQSMALQCMLHTASRRSPRQHECAVADRSASACSEP